MLISCRHDEGEKFKIQFPFVTGAISRPDQWCMKAHLFPGKERYDNEVHTTTATFRLSTRNLLNYGGTGRRRKRRKGRILVCKWNGWCRWCWNLLVFQASMIGLRVHDGWWWCFWWRTSAATLWNRFRGGWPIRRYSAHSSSTTGQLEQDGRDWSPMSDPISRRQFLAAAAAAGGRRPSAVKSGRSRFLTIASGWFLPRQMRFHPRFQLTAQHFSTLIFFSLFLLPFNSGLRKETGREKEKWFDISFNIKTGKIGWKEALSPPPPSFLSVYNICRSILLIDRCKKLHLSF
jgi:hypothetical protein